MKYDELFWITSKPMKSARIWMQHFKNSGIADIVEGGIMGNGRKIKATW